MGVERRLAEGEQRDGQSAPPPAGHLQCPFCRAYSVQRLFLPSLDCDACSCDACTLQWDEERGTGVIRSRGGSSVLLRPDP